ncbi:PREDICTED: E3 ubiquitin-protein ligase RNF4 [Nanorana parkeri]|uniref:E3 ubiquitin-protein ligase RNF4 n=1 Tax=Nanorana parkeri TaxID=125878 RepID=UPI000854D1F0|nr:PREDICTED: E3 ubiquitin-protein ligase RNF4 [Nanorana parkeri]
MNSAQRKRRGSQSTKTRSSHKRRRGNTSTSAMTTVIELEESVDEVVDLTCESYEPSVVDLTDLTHNDSVVIVEEHQGQRRNRRNPASGSSHVASILSSDDEDSRDNDICFGGSKSSDVTSSHNTRSRSTGGNIICPICMDSYSEIVQNGRLIVSTKCGHIFCSQCLRDALKNATSCPTCRKKLTHKQYHPIYI